MPRSLVLIILMIGSYPTMVWADYPKNVKEAIDVIIIFCVAGGEEYKILGDAKLQGGVALKKLGVTGGGEIKISKSEARGLVKGLRNEMNKIGGEQASQARECMRPYIDRILEELLDNSRSADGGNLDRDTNGCRLLRSKIITPIEVKKGSCFLSENQQYRSEIKMITQNAVVFWNFRGKEVACFLGDICSFGWPNSPRFGVNFSAHLVEKIYIVNAN